MDGNAISGTTASQLKRWPPTSICSDAVFAEGGFPWEETGTIDRHITCGEKPANEVHRNDLGYPQFTGYRTILTTLVLVCGFAPPQTDHVPNEGDPAPAFFF